VSTTPLITLDCNEKMVASFAEQFAQIQSRSLAERAAARKKEIADSGLSDLSKLKTAEGHFINLAIHADSFLDDAAVQEDVGPNEPIVWKSRYAPTVGVVAASMYGNAPATLYATQDNYATLSPFAFEVEEVKVPKLALTQDVTRLGQREAGLARQAEAIKLKFQQFIINIMLNQAIGTDLATSITNYVTAGNPYQGRTVYMLDPGVQSTSVEASNIVNVSAEGGITPAVLEAIQAQAFLQQKMVRTLHIPVAGQPWRKLLRAATVVANSAVFGSGVLPNAGLKAIPEKKWAELFDSNLNQGKSMAINWFGETWKIKANNLMPAGYGIVTTNEPAVALYHILEKNVSTDVVDQRDSYFVGHYEKREIALAQPDPWLRNFMVVNFGATSNL